MFVGVFFTSGIQSHKKNNRRSPPVGDVLLDSFYKTPLRNLRQFYVNMFVYSTGTETLSNAVRTVLSDKNPLFSLFRNYFSMKTMNPYCVTKYLMDLP